MELNARRIMIVELIMVIFLGMIALVTAPLYMTTTDGPFGPGSRMVSSPEAGDGRWMAFTEYAASRECRFTNSLNGMDTVMTLPEESGNVITRGAIWFKTQMTGSVKCDTTAVAVPPVGAEMSSWRINESTTETVLVNEARRSGIGVVDPREVERRTPGFTFAGTTGPGGSTYFQAMERLMPRTWWLVNGEPEYETIGTRCFVVRNDQRLSVESYMDDCAAQ